MLAYQASIVLFALPSTFELASAAGLPSFAGLFSAAGLPLLLEAVSKGLKRFNSHRLQLLGRGRLASWNIQAPLLPVLGVSRH